MWIGGSYDYDDVVRALVRLDRPEMRPGTSGQKRQDRTDIFHRPRSGCTDNRSRDLDTTQYGPTTLERDSRRNAKRTSISARTERRRSHAMEQSPSRGFSTSPTMVRRQLKKTRYRRHCCRLDQLSDTLGTGLPERSLNVTQKSRGFFWPQTRCKWQVRDLRHEALSTTQNDERYDRTTKGAVRPGENSKGFITVAKPSARRPFFLGASWTFVTLDPGEVLWDTGAQEGLVGKQQLDKWCKIARGTRSPS